ncbi:hypothetical protein OSSY52_20690 [Tepiditoga spiralis]|uniref:Bacterial type II secretion system protein E domain-containing protein n=1 Tax=Tepiditoga spiralis TaxID=2108365 RepID=A0A7G1G5R0_9BACT|nr:ATPase, T2SS/T4P/T4SS family [Tepiditoga spiralis]BBE31928.1 hypothetical protein OSSY52_20690 [Tepiditoga spiralis]
MKKNLWNKKKKEKYKISEKESFSDLFYRDKEYLQDEGIFFHIFFENLDKRISDFHFESNDNNVKIKIRYSGKLIDYKTIKKAEYLRFINIVLIHCKKDIIRNNYNVDGSFNLNGFNYRVSMMDSFFGVSTVIRRLRNIEDINIEFNNNLLKKVFENTQKKSKTILFSGPTGSGKSTTMLYIVNKLKSEYKIHTIENPIEYIIPEIVQIPIKTDDESEMILKYILRQDPEIIVAGEIRDKNFAKLIFNASTTGHTVYASIHSDSVFSALNRLINLVENKKNIVDSIDIIINQKLKPKNCTNCQGTGCKKCYYTGRDGVEPNFEYMILNKKIKEDIINGISIIELENKYKNILVGGAL